MNAPIPVQEALKLLSMALERYLAKVEDERDAFEREVEALRAERDTLMRDGMAGNRVVYDLRKENMALKSERAEMGAIFEAVMKAIRGEPLSDFELSHVAVYEAQMLREANNAHARITGDLRAQNAALKARVEELTPKTVHQFCCDFCGLAGSEEYDIPIARRLEASNGK